MPGFILVLGGEWGCDRAGEVEALMPGLCLGFGRRVGPIG